MTCFLSILLVIWQQPHELDAQHKQNVKRDLVKDMEWEIERKEQ